MKKLIEKFKGILTNKLLWIGLIFVLFFVPTALITPSAGTYTLIATAMGVDVKNNETIISIEYLNPGTDANISDSVAVISESGKNLPDALSNLSAKVGKKVGFENITVVLFADSFKDENLLESCNYLFKNKKIPLSAKIVFCTGEAADIIGKTNELDEDGTDTLGSISDENAKTTNGVSSSIGRYLEKAPDGTALTTENGGALSSLPHIEILPIYEEKQAAVFIKNGKLILNNGTVGDVLKIEDEPFKGLLYLSKKTKEGEVIIDKNGYEFISKEVKLKTQVDNDKLKVNYNIKLDLLNGAGKNEKEQIKTKIKNDISKTLEFAKTNNIDIFNIFEEFYNFKTSAFKEFIKNYPDYIKQLEVDVDVSFKG
jgi:hypothetical protein